MSPRTTMETLANIVPPRSRLYQGFFGRLFPELPAWEPPFRNRGRTVDEQADAYFQSVAIQIHKDGAENPDSTLPAGYTYFGQFIDHDITFDPASSLVRQNDPNMLHNFRTPRLDLDNLYLSGPQASPYLYERDKDSGQPIGCFLIGKGRNKNEPDLPRNQIGTAIIGDPRNDENVIVSQLQLAFLQFHNYIFKAKLAELKDPQAAFTEARRIVTWTYQYVVWHDFIKRIINDKVWSSVLALPPDPDSSKNDKVGSSVLTLPPDPDSSEKAEPQCGIKRWKLNTSFYDWRNTPFMPIEFSAAAYRFGHSLVRNSYQVNLKVGVPNRIPILKDNKDDLRGGRPLGEGRTIQWDWFLKLPSSVGSFPQKSRKIDTSLAAALANIPAGPGRTTALAFLNLKRGWRMGLPSGPSVARHLGLKPISVDPHEEALWLYILKEAAALPGDNAGNKLGWVGSVIVGEVFAGLLAGDPNSFFNIDPLWTPSKEALLADKGPWQRDDKDETTHNKWELGDIIRLAQMPENGDQVISLIDKGQFTSSVQW